MARKGARRFEDNELELVWAALETLDVSLQHALLRELATELNEERLDPRSAQGRIRAGILSLNHAADFLGHSPSQSEYREVRRRHPDLELMPDSTVRRLLGDVSWQDCLRRAFLPAESEGDFVKHEGGRAFTEEEVLTAVSDCLRDRGGRVPVLHDYLAWATDPGVRARPGCRPASATPFRRFGGFRACLARVGVSVSLGHRINSAGKVVPLQRGYTDQEMRDAVREVASHLGRTPRHADYRDAREAAASLARQGRKVAVPPSSSCLINRFGSWNDVIAVAGLAALTQFSRPRKLPRRPRYSPELKLQSLRKAWVEIGPPLTPSAYEAWRHELLAKAQEEGKRVQIPGCDSIAKEFQGWRRARTLAVPQDAARTWTA